MRSSLNQLALVFFLLSQLAGNAHSGDGKAALGDKDWISDPTDRRIALVVGNADYIGVADDLSNPVNDARAVSKKLGAMGYKVTTVENGDSATIRSQLDEFISRARDANVAFFFYAGHGVQILSRDGTSLRNQLLPTDYALQETGTDAKMIDLAEFLERLEKTGVPTRIWVLDACRNTPGGLKIGDSEDQHETFEVDVLDRKMAAASILRNSKTRSIRLRGTGETVASSGFGEMIYQAGTLVVYATGTGKVVPDQLGQSPNSPFTTALVTHIDDPDSNVEDVLKRVNTDVVSMTAKFSVSQTPLVVNALQKDVFLVARMPRIDFYTRVQKYLKIAGCFTGNPDGKWGKGSMRSLAAFTAMSNLPINIDRIDMGTLNAMRSYITSQRFEFCKALPASGGPLSPGDVGSGSTIAGRGTTKPSAARRAPEVKANKPPVGNPYVGGGVGVPF